MEFTRTKVKEMIEHQQNKYSWVFMFLGANMDAVSEADSLGINARFARTYTASDIGTESVYSATACAMSALRSIDLAECDALESAKAYCDAIASLDSIV